MFDKLGKLFSQGNKPFEDDDNMVNTGMNGGDPNKPFKAQGCTINTDEHGNRLIKTEDGQMILVAREIHIAQLGEGGEHFVIVKIGPLSFAYPMSHEHAQGFAKALLQIGK